MLLLVSFLPPLLRSPSLMRLSISGFLGWGSQGKGCQCELFCTLKGFSWLGLFSQTGPLDLTLLRISFIISCRKQASTQRRSI